ncbi:MAG TPA: VTT domain-containing protein [Mycobacteriales bacterium]|jgi:membrane-associated protein|nr:VTT domain-containing protein [Mycobacteriales bacterium]
MSAASFLSPNHLIDTFGLVGLLVIIFAECGLLIGFFLPGDTLLFTAGLLVSNNLLHKPLWMLLVFTPIAAILGNVVGYWIGARTGPSVFNKPDSRLFKQEHVDRAHDFFERYGPATIFLARFVPVVRTFVTVMAGASRMRLATYLSFSVLGGLIWTIGVTVAGYFLGKIKIIRDNVDLILVLGVLAAVCVTAVPLVMRYVSSRRNAGPARHGAHAASRPDSE